jgi:hypothetical protein
MVPIHLRVILAVDLLEPNCVGVDFVSLDHAVETTERVPELLHHVAREHQSEHVEVPVVRLGSHAHEGGPDQLQQERRIHAILT